MFANLSNFTGMSVVSLEKKKINSLLRKKMDARKGCGYKVVRGKRKTLLASHLESEIRKLECLMNYKHSWLTIKG